MGKRARRYARRVYRSVRRRAAKQTIPLAALAGIAGMPSVSGAITKGFAGDWNGAIQSLKGMAGITSSGQFDTGTLYNNAVPLMAGLLVHKAAGLAGVNRVLAQAKVPFLRV